MALSIDATGLAARGGDGKCLSTGNPRWSACWAVWRADHAGPPVTRFLRYADHAQGCLDQCDAG
jgi:hypothetical protein